jgi:hypothetical protein
MKEMSSFLQGVLSGLCIGAMIRLFILLNKEIDDYFLKGSRKFIETIKGYLPNKFFQFDIEKS